MQVAIDEVPRRLRRRFLDKPSAKWLVPAERCIALPDAVKRNRFLVPLCVFIFVFLTFDAIVKIFQLAS